MPEIEGEERQFSANDILGIARRRFWWILVPALLGPFAGYLISRLLTPVFTSQAFVLVEQQKVPDTFVPSMITDQLETRLMTLQEQILSRSRLQPIIEEFGLYKEEQKHATMDERVVHLRGDIRVKPIRPDGTNALRGFYVEVDERNAATAQQVCTRVLSMFMDENLKVRSERAQSTTDFLASQLEEAKQKLNLSDGKLADFKSRYIGRLPTDEQSNLQTLSSLTSRLDVVNEAIAQAEQQKAMQASLLAQHSVSGTTGKGTLKRGDLDQQLSELRVQLAGLEAHYTADYPDVIKTKGQIERLERQLQMQKPAIEPATEQKDQAPESPDVVQLRTSLRAADDNLRRRRAEQASLEQQIAGFQTRIQLSPKVEEEFKLLTRDYESSLQFYNELFAKRTQADMVRDLEQKQEGEQFHVVDAPSLPAKPSSPNRPKLTLAGLAAGFALGAALAALFEFKERFIRTEQDIKSHIGLPILAVIQNLNPK